MSSIQFQRSLCLRHEVDVFVAGGGPAGCAAAIAAARNGAKVFLAEEQACLGGLGTAGLVPAFMSFGDGVNFLADGLGREIQERLWQYGGEEYAASKTNAIKAEALKRVYDDLLAEAGVEFALHTQLIDVQTQGEDIDYCVLAGKSGVYAVKAKVYIDCTGDGDLAAWAGAPYEKGDSKGRMMAGTLCALWADIDWARKQGRDGEFVEKAFQDGVFKKLDLHFTGMFKVAEHVGGSNTGHVFDVDGTDERSLTEGLVYTRRLYEEIQAYYHKYLPGFEEMELVSTGSLLGIRETRRITGEYRLVLEDFITRAVFEDEIGRLAYPVDIHPEDNSKEAFAKFQEEFQKFRYQKGESYGIPYRALVPLKVNNLLVAGRCVSTDRPMQSSIRIMPGCYITGQAAGVAAAICAREDVAPRAVDARRIQKILKGMGMFLPNYPG